MAAKKKEKAVVVSQKELTTGIYDLTLKTSLEISAPGQFISIYTNDASKLLPRPISICDAGNGTLRMVYRVAGEGTKQFSKLKASDELDILGVLGNGFDISVAKGKKVLVFGGGIGIPPMLGLCKTLKNEGIDVTAVLGYRNNDMFLKAEFDEVAKVYVATEDGSVGTKGNVLDAVKENGLSGDVLFSCGPMPMLRALKYFAQENNMKAYISLEERMACGVGACLGCVCKTTKKDEHSQVNNARICTDGPVFDAEEVDL